MIVESGFSERFEATKKIPDYKVNCQCSDVDTVEEYNSRDQKMKKVYLHRCNNCGNEGKIEFNFNGNIETKSEEHGLVYTKL